MNIAQALNAPWTRKHDIPSEPLFDSVPVIAYPQSLEELVTLCSSRPQNKRMHPAGSHWALSPAAISDSIFVETHDFNEIFPAMGRTLYNVLPQCVTEEYISILSETLQDASDDLNLHRTVLYPMHVEAGKRIYQLYSELDFGEPFDRPESSLAAFLYQETGAQVWQGSWAFGTLGGAGGQTVFGALTTGTHGGDFNLPPIADAVIAIHLVVDGGKHYWIERDSAVPLTDAEKLRQVYGAEEYGGAENFDIIRDDDAFNAVLIGCGRFGVVYSVVLGVVPQYGLHQRCKLANWSDVKGLVSQRASSLFTETFTENSKISPQRFLQIVLCLSPTAGGDDHLCGITRRWTLPETSVGRVQRRGDRSAAYNRTINAHPFSRAGNSIPYSKDDDPDKPGQPSFLQIACADSNFFEGIVEAICEEIAGFLEHHTLETAGAVALAVGTGAVDALTPLAPWLAAILALLLAILEKMREDGNTRFAQSVDEVRGALLDNPDPIARAAGVLIWRVIAIQVFKSQQPEEEFSAISYAVMDTHDYTDRSCQVNVRSTEVFFDATDPNLIAFCDRLLKFESDQQTSDGKATVGYVSLRFCGRSQGLLAPEQFAETVAVECSALADAKGGTDFVDYAVRLALDPNINGILHWGQQNDSTATDIEFRFGVTAQPPRTNLARWRRQLARFTGGAASDGFSSEFTRRVGLEI